MKHRCFASPACKMFSRLRVTLRRGLIAVILPAPLTCLLVLSQSGDMGSHGLFTSAQYGITSKKTPVLPIDAYELALPQQVQLVDLNELLVKRCMARHGFSILPNLTRDAEANVVRIQEELNSRLWGISTMQVAKRYGYGLPPWISGPGRPTPTGSLSAKEQLTLTGIKPRDVSTKHAPGESKHVPLGGCQGWAARALAKVGLSLTQSTTEQLVSQISMQSFFEAKASRAVQTAFQRWSACMSQHGYDYSSPFSHPSANATDAARSEEIDTAVTDITCKRSTNFFPVVYGAEAKAQEALIDQHKQVLGTLRQQVENERQAILKLVREEKMS